jgi:hypothetical protein
VTRPTTRRRRRGPPTEPLEVRVDLPDAEANRLSTQRQIIAESLDKLAALAAVTVHASPRERT